MRMTVQLVHKAAPLPFEIGFTERERPTRGSNPEPNVLMAKQ